MNHDLGLVFAGTGPLFGNQWLALLAILVLIAAFMAAVALVGRWLAMTHPASKAAVPAAAATPAPAASPAVEDRPSPETLAIIAAAVRVALGAHVRIAQVLPVKPAAPSVEMLMQQWSMEGRRQIYSSHQIR